MLGWVGRIKFAEAGLLIQLFWLTLVLYTTTWTETERRSQLLLVSPVQLHSGFLLSFPFFL